MAASVAKWGQTTVSGWETVVCPLPERLRLALCLVRCPPIFWPVLVQAIFLKRTRCLAKARVAASVAKELGNESRNSPPVRGYYGDLQLW